MLFSPPLHFVLTLAAFLLLGCGIALRLWERETVDVPHPLERALAAITIAVAAWLAIDWVLALTHTLTRPVLLSRTVLVLLIGAALVASRWRLFTRQVDVARMWLVVVLPLMVWVVFIVWRGSITPPLTHDALSNHLPRAVLYGRLHGFEDLTLLSPAFRDMPANYELLLADVILMDRHDLYTEWFSAFCYVALALAGGALAWRWWRSTPITILSMLALAAAPVALLHSGADKNDLLTGTFAIAALVWGGRYWRTSDFTALLLLPVSLLIAIGTKPQAACVAVPLLPLVIWRAARDLHARRVRVRHLFLATAIGLLSFVLLGGYTYIDQHLRRLRPAATGASKSWSAKPVRVIAYGDWANLWQGPYVMAAAPFASSPYRLDVPWDKPWFWKRYEIYFSHLGVPFALCFLGAPFAVRAWRGGDERKERVAIGLASVAALLILLPGSFVPHGTYVISLPRYAMFFAAPVIAWTTGALFHAVSRQTPRAFVLLSAAAVGFFVWYAIDFALHDDFAPLDFVLLARDYPDARYIPFDPYRATSTVDRLAGPHDAIAIDATWASWVHPVFGARLTRPVYFIPPGDGPVRIPPSAKWVVVERAYAMIWGHKQMKTLGDARRYFTRNKPSPEDRRVIEALRRDPKFKLVWYERRRTQAVFKRVE